MKRRTVRKKNYRQDTRRNIRNSRRFGRFIFYFGLLFFFIIASQQLFNYSDRAEKNRIYHYYSIKPTIEKQQNFDVHYYDLNFNVNIDTSMKRGNMRANAGIYFTSREARTRKILLNFSDILTIDSIAGIKSYTRRENTLEILLLQPLERGEEDSLRIYYHGWPKPYHEWIPGWKVIPKETYDGKKFPLLTTVNPPYGAQTWFPCKDHPSDKADSLRIEVTVPDSLQVISNGKLARKTTTGHRTCYTWKETYPIATYLAAVNIGRFNCFKQRYSSSDGGDFPVEFYSFATDSSFLQLVYRQMEYMLDYYSSLLGPYPFEKEKYAMVTYSTIGGMENQTVSGVREINPRREILYAHELVHQWLGNSVTYNSFHETWISEGLATYFSGLYLRKSQGEEAFQSFLKMHRSLKPAQIWVVDTVDPDSIYAPNAVYDKACWFFRMLHQRLGDTLFFRAVRTMLEKYRYRTIDYKQLQNVFESVSGKEMSRFFSQWIFEKQAPILDVKIADAESEFATNGYRYNLKVSQVQPSKKPYFLTLEVHYTGEGNQQKTLTYEIFKRDHEFTLILPYRVKRIEVDPQNKILLGVSLSYEFN